MHYAIELWF